MRILLVASALLAATSSVDAFAPCQRVAPFGSSTALQSTVAADAASIKARLDAQLEKMKAKDASSKALSKEVSLSCFCAVPNLTQKSVQLYQRTNRNWKEQIEKIHQDRRIFSRLNPNANFCN